MIQVLDIVKLQNDCIESWKSNGATPLLQKDFMAVVEENHSFNFLLWATEDKARRDDMGFEFVYQAKRKIDDLNQQRNNRVEAMDDFLYQLLQPSSLPNCPIHSETPGMMIDRLSILALKIYHMGIQKNRQEVDQQHQQSCEQKLIILIAQRDQLANCLQQLLGEILAQTRTFKTYRQFKMYNDPSLNPELYDATL